jgi:hypothetical protein
MKKLFLAIMARVGIVYPLIKIENIIARRVTLIVHLPVLILHPIVLSIRFYFVTLRAHAKGFFLAWTYRAEATPRKLATEALHAVGLEPIQDKETN